MNELELFNKIFEYASKNTTCNKLAVGACFVANDGKEFFSCNHENNGHNCKKMNECYKFKVTGIYQSCEETRKYCQATHAEINMINYLKKLGVDPSDGILYVSRYPCENCAREISYAGFKHIKYCGKQEISRNVRDILSSQYVDWYSDIDYEYK